MSTEEIPRLPAVEIAHRSDPGRDPQKQINEDACGARATRFGHLCVVCDGMGGHAGGREASTLALATIFEAFDAAPPTIAPREILRDAIAQANARVRALPSEDESARPGSTVVAVLLHASGTEVAHVGDSRAYLAHAGQIFQLTRDHSMVQQMVDARMLTPAQAAQHPEANKITRALGIDDTVDVELRAQPVPHVAGDVLVLCSDGLSDLVEPPEILSVVSTDPPAQAAGKLVDLANARGGHDNITVLVLRARESASATAGGAAPTLVQTVPQLVTQPPAAPVIPPAPPSRDLAHPRARAWPFPTSAIAGYAIAAAAVVAAIIVFYILSEGRRGAHHEQVNPALSGPLPTPPPPPSGPLTISPQPLEAVPQQDAAATDASPPLPLTPIENPSVHHPHPHKGTPR